MCGGSHGRVRGEKRFRRPEIRDSGEPRSLPGRDGFTCGAFKDNPAVKHSEDHREIADLLRRNSEVVPGEDDQIGEIAFFSVSLIFSSKEALVPIRRLLV